MRTGDDMAGREKALERIASGAQRLLDGEWSKLIGGMSLMRIIDCREILRELVDDIANIPPSEIVFSEDTTVPCRIRICITRVYARESLHLDEKRLLDAMMKMVKRIYAPCALSHDDATFWMTFTMTMHPRKQPRKDGDTVVIKRQRK